MAVESIAKTLGTGSGIDTTALVDQLVTAQFDAKNTQLSNQSDALDTKISAVSDIKSAISSFNTALKQLVKGGTLNTQPTSSNTGIVTAKATSGSTANLSGLSASIQVQQLAASQVANTTPFADSTSAIGTGTLTITLGTASVSNGQMTSFTAGSGTPVNITIDSTNNSLDGIAKAINAAGAGVTASVLSDSDGARLVLKSATGADQAFTLSATEDSSAPGLSALDVGVGAGNTTIGTAAQDAVVAVDGVSVKRSSNQISDLIDGVTLNLVSASPGTTVQIGSQAQTDNLRNAVNDFVDTYNQVMSTLQTDTDSKTGPLSTDTAARALQSALSQLTLTNLVNDEPSGSPQTLAEIGISTNRDGSLSVNTDQLDSALSNFPRAVEKMFSPGLLSTGDGLSAALDSITTRATSVVYGLGASAASYTTQKQHITDEQTQAASDADAMRTRLTQQFASMDSKVAAYKSTQTFLTQQINAWNSSSNG